MITLITGSPGSGKTAYVVDQLHRIIEHAHNTGLEPRPIYTMGIPELELPVHQIPPVNEWTYLEVSEEDPSITIPKFTFPDGSLIVIDEAQKVFRQRPIGSRVPDIVAAFETHRHKGLDFWLITQRPTQIDSHVRGLVGRHIHLRSYWAGRKLYESDEVFDPKSRSDLDMCIARPYSLPNKVFHLYKSASIHIKPERRKPITLYVILALIPLAAALAWKSYQTINDKKTNTTTKQKTINQPTTTITQTPIEPQTLPHPYLSNNGASIDDWKPRIIHRPETAPLYDSIRVPQQMPIVVGCIKSARRCKCYTSQATDAFIPYKECLDWIEKPSFNPWQPVSTTAEEAHR